MDNAKLVLSDAKENLKSFARRISRYVHTYIFDDGTQVHTYAYIVLQFLLLYYVASYMPTYKISSLYIYNFRTM